MSALPRHLVFSAIPPALTTNTPEIDLGNNNQQHIANDNQEYGSNWLIISAALNLVQMVLELLINFVTGISISLSPHLGISFFSFVTVLDHFSLPHI